MVLTIEKCTGYEGNGEEVDEQLSHAAKIDGFPVMVQVKHDLR